MNLILDTYNDFIGFLKNPTDTADANQSGTLRMKRLFAILAIELPVMALLLAIIGGLESFGLIDTSQHKINLLLQSIPIPLMLLIGVLIIPFFEEVIFRLFLRFKYNIPFQLFISFSGIRGKFYKLNMEGFLLSVWQRYYSFVFYFAAFIFGFVHILNYDFSWIILLLFPILIAPQFIIGLFIGYLRVRYTFMLGFLLHALHNLIFLLAAFFLLSNTTEKLNIENEDYSLKIREYRVNQMNSTYSNKVDTINITNGNFKSIIAKLLDKDINFIEFGDSEYLDISLDIELINHSKTNHMNQIALEHLISIYNFKIDTVFKDVSVWEIMIDDTVKLHKFRTDDREGSITFANADDRIILENSDMENIANAIMTNYPEFIFDNTDYDERFDMTIEKQDFEDLKEQLNTKFGILLIQETQEIEFIAVHFL